MKQTASVPERIGDRYVPTQGSDDPKERRGCVWWTLNELAKFIAETKRRPSHEELARYLRYDARETKSSLWALRRNGLARRMRNGWIVTPVGESYLKLDSQQLGWLMLGDTEPEVMPHQLHEGDLGDDDDEEGTA